MCNVVLKCSDSIPENTTDPIHPLIQITNILHARHCAIVWNSKWNMTQPLSQGAHTLMMEENT